MKRIIVSVSKDGSIYFPIKARWTLNHVKYSDVFETESQMKSYFSRFYPAEIVYKEVL